MSRKSKELERLARIAELTPLVAIAQEAYRKLQKELVNLRSRQSVSMYIRTPEGREKNRVRSLEYWRRKQAERKANTGKVKSHG